MTDKNLVLSGKSLLDFQIKNPILIGEWILENLDQNKIDNIECQYFNSKSHSKKNRVDAFKIAETIHESIKLDLIKELNKLHSVNFSNRSWQIIFGYWLIHFIGVCVERYQRINEVLENENIKNIYLKKCDNFKFYSKDTFGLNLNSIDEDWENNLYLKIINFLNIDKNLLFSESKQVGNEITINQFYKTDSKNLKEFLLEKIFRSLNFLGLNNKLITNTYLPGKYEILLQILLGQVPSKFYLEEVDYKNYDEKTRKSINLFKDKNKNLENFIRLILPECLPICMVESFQDILHNCEKIGYPKNPKFIFTSNSYVYDEFFKFFTAKKVEEKTSYFIGQHGNDYFTNLNLEEKVDFESSNKFISWGFKNQKNILKGFNFKILNQNFTFDKYGKLLIISSPSLHRIFPYDKYREFKDSLEKISLLKDSLEEKISNKIILKLDENFKSKDGNYYRKNILKNFENSEISYGDKSLKNLISRSRLCVFNYDSTGILENLLLNIPTVAIWSNNDNNLRKEFEAKYSTLKNAKILFNDINELTNHINNNWDNVSKWWFSDEVQIALKKFNDEFNIKGNINSLLKLKKEIKVSIHD